nr:RNA-directed DNA polymerase, eukaryota, reverse transcriptase zinc-binding domain protein [Tanacetum cinerariifolium]
MYGFHGGIDLLSLCSRKLGNGVSIRLWDDVWWGDTCLKSLFTRMYLLDTERSSSIANRVGLQDWSRVLRRVPRVVFKKAFDSLKWDFLDLVMDKIGFGYRRHSWIKGCLCNARASVLVNGSPTKELRFLEVLDKSISIGDNNLCISHLMYADDVIFTGEWSITNARNLLVSLGMSNDDIQAMANVIGCGAATLPFKYLGIPAGCNMSRFSYWEPIINKFSSRLSLWKARLLSAGGRLTLIKSVLGSLPLYFMSLYMETSKGNGGRYEHANPVSLKAQDCHIIVQIPWLSLWKAHLLSAGGRLTLIESVLGSLPLYFMSLYMVWKKCLASKNMGGLGIGSIFALNVGFLFKWIWRFLCNSTDLWIIVIKEMYGFHGGIFDENMQRSSLSPWCGILSSIKALKNKGIDLLSLCSRKLGNGVSIRFWDDVWWGDTCLKFLFPRVYLLDTERSSSVANRVGLQDWSRVLRRVPRGGVEATQLADLHSFIVDVVLSDQDDSWSWAPNVPKGFSVASVRSYIDHRILVVSSIATRWNHIIPIKVNVFYGGCR